ncbi:MAG: hypothetical protein PHS34_07760 [Candidatus Omnitrophica bacterium]|nr:hypothetical protein [Candidatus Omnitrophota bacterium]
MEKKLGRKLREDEECHHRDHNPLNGNPDNLEAMIIKEHKIETFKGKNALRLYRKKKGV